MADGGESGVAPPRATALACVRAAIEASDAYHAARRALAVVDDPEDVDRAFTPDGPQALGSVGEDGPWLCLAGDAWALDTYNRVVVLGAGKAADRLAAGVCETLDERVDDGLVVTDDRERAEGTDDEYAPDGHHLALDVPAVGVPDPVTVRQASHPLPDDRGLAAAERVESLADAADRKTLVVIALTGGGSALLPAPAGDLTSSELRTLTATLVESGEPIAAVNAVRKHCSRLKGGLLARLAAPATVLGLAVSDVVGDDLATIASGPTVPDPTTYRDALDITDRAGVTGGVREHLRAGAESSRETPKAGDACFERARTVVLAGGERAVRAVRETARGQGYDAVTLSETLEGAATAVGRTLASATLATAAGGTPVDPPAVVVGAGETTVTLDGATGEGGPNTEAALAAGVALADRDGDAALAAVDTDGRDGPPGTGRDPAGAMIDPDTVTDASAAERALSAHDAREYLRRLGALLHTGPTGTNVADLYVAAVDGEQDTRGDGLRK
jgi:Putative glycerate kinase